MVGTLPSCCCSDSSIRARGREVLTEHLLPLYPPAQSSPWSLQRRRSRAPVSSPRRSAGKQPSPAQCGQWLGSPTFPAPFNSHVSPGPGLRWSSQSLPCCLWCQSSPRCPWRCLQRCPWRQSHFPWRLCAGVGEREKAGLHGWGCSLGLADPAVSLQGSGTGVAGQPRA